MPASFTIDASRRLVTSRLWGDVTDAELRQQHAALRAAPEFDPSYAQLIDARGLDVGRISGETLSSLASTSNFAPDTRRAVVADEDSAFGVARMFSAWSAARGHEVRVFRDLASADAWLKEPER